MAQVDVLVLILCARPVGFDKGPPNESIPHAWLVTTLHPVALHSVRFTHTCHCASVALNVHFNLTSLTSATTLLLSLNACILERLVPVVRCGLGMLYFVLIVQVDPVVSMYDALVAAFFCRS